MHSMAQLNTQVVGQHLLAKKCHICHRSSHNTSKHIVNTHTTSIILHKNVAMLARCFRHPLRMLCNHQHTTKWYSCRFTWVQFICVCKMMSRSICMSTESNKCVLNLFLSTLLAKIYSTEFTMGYHIAGAYSKKPHPTYCSRILLIHAGRQITNLQR